MPPESTSDLQPSSGTSTPRFAGAAHRLRAPKKSRWSLPPDLLEAASRRLGYAAILLGALFFLGHLQGKLYLFLSNDYDLETFAYKTFYRNLMVVTLVLCTTVFALTRVRRIPPSRILHIGLVFQVAAAFLISMAEVWPSLLEGIPLTRVSWVAVWLIVFPIILPSSPSKTFLAAVGSALTGPFAMLAAIHWGGAEPPPPADRVLMFVPNYVAVFIAMFVSRIVYRLGTNVAEARDMGSYKLVERLGEGGMGEVWRAEHRFLARPAAIKLIRAEALGAAGGAGIATLKARFEREAQTTASLESPHTVQLYDFGVADDGTFYYVMELLHGLDLETLVQRFGPIPAERAVHLLQQACLSLDEAHRNHLVHRDVKPANLYTCRLAGDFDFVKILDFGLVKNEAAPANDERLTMADTTQGTPAYMPPEMAVGTSDVDGRADLYSLGCVAYWLITGKMVFEGGSPMQVVIEHVQTAPIPPSQRAEVSVSPELDAVILRCLAKKPEERFATASALGEALATCPEADGWTRDRAARWWDAHVPAAEPAPQATETRILVQAS